MANRFWVGGAGNWDASTTTHWASVSNGAGGASVPTAADDVFLDAIASGTITITAAAFCRSLDCTGLTRTLVLSSQTLNVGDGSGGALKLVAGMTLTINTSSLIKFVSTTDNSGVGWGITTGTKTMPPCTFDGVGGKWALQDSFTTPATAVITLTNGSLDTNGKTCQWGKFASNNSNTRALAFGGSQITVLSGTASTIWDITNPSGMTLNAGSSTLIFNGTGGALQPVMAFGGLTYNNIQMTSTGAAFTTYELLDNVIISGLLTISGGGGQRILIGSSDVNGTVRTITAASVSLTNVTFRDIGAAGVSIPWTGTALGDAQGNSNITFPASITYYWIGGTGSWNSTTHWSLTSGGSGFAGIPLAQDNVIFDHNSFSAPAATVTMDGWQLCRNFDASDVTNNPAFLIGGSNNAVIYGNLVFGAMTMPTGGVLFTLSLRAASSCTIKSNGATLFTGSGTLPLVQIISRGSGSYTLLDNFNIGNASFRHQAGTFDANGHNVTATSFGSTTGSGVLRTLNMGSGTWAITGLGFAGSGWSYSNPSGVTLNPGTSLIDFTETSSTTRQMGFGGFIYNKVRFAVASTAIFAVGGASGGGCNQLIVSGGGKTIQFSSANTTNLGSFNITGDPGNVIFIRSSTPGTPATISLPVGAACLYVNVQDSTVIPVARVYPGGILGTGNLNWLSNAGNFAAMGAGG